MNIIARRGQVLRLLPVQLVSGVAGLAQAAGKGMAQIQFSQRP